MKLEDVFNETHFSSTEAVVVNYLQESPWKVSSMTLRDVAREVYVSPATVLRVVKKCGYDGWRSFCADLLLYSEQEKQQSVAIDMSRPFGSRQSAARMVASMRSLFDQTISETSSMISLKVLEQAAEKLLQAERIFLFAQGDSAITVRSFQNKLTKINLHPVFAGEFDQEIEESLNMHRKDVALFVSYHGKSPLLIRCASFLQKKQVYSILVTKKNSGPLQNLCSAVLHVPAHEEKRRIANFHSQIAMEFVLDVLYSLIYQKNFDQNERHKTLLDETQ